jgi:dipeptidyl aminopeptidase/acylaminoacyl peptidase
MNRGSAVKSRYLFCALTLCLASLAAAQAPPPPAAFAALPAVQSPAISPDGERIAYIARTGDGTFVYAVRLATNQADAIIGVDPSRARAVVWANNDTLILLASETETVTFAARMVEALSPYGIDLAGELRVRQLAGSRAVGGGFFVRGRRLIGYDRATGRVLAPVGGVLYSVNAKNGDMDQIDNNTSGFTRDWVVDENAVPRYRLDYRDRLDYLQILRRTGNGLWETFVEQTLDLPEIDLHGLDAAGDLVVGGRPRDVGRYGLYTVSPDGTRGRTVYAHDTLEVSEVYVDPYTNRVVGAEAEGERPLWFDEELARQQATLETTFPGESPTILDWSQDRSRFIVQTERSDRAPLFYLFDAAERTANELASTYPALERTTLPQRLPYRYEARDGVGIPGYLTRPLGIDGPVPLVVLPHRGPVGRDVDGFDWLAHFLASRGYAVLQPNYRGSDGYGRAWEEAGHGGWGVGVMQHDLTDGVAALSAAGIADPQRVCIVGASYGGYDALAGAAFTPELYRCAVSINGVADLRDMHVLYTSRRDSRSAAVTYWERSVGVEGERSARAALEALSPARQVEGVQAAVLLIHGRDDSVVPIGQSRGMERALRAAGKAVQFVELEGEDHWLSDAPTRLETLVALEAFLAEHLRGR